MTGLAHLEQLEAESIDILREAVAESERPAMFYSIGKNSSVMLHLAMKAFYPSKLPFPLLHVDSTWKFRDMIAFRDATAKKYGLELIVHISEKALAEGINPFTHGFARHTQMWEIDGLTQAMERHRFDLAFSGARRDAQKSRARERIFSFRSAQSQWSQRTQRPELWRLYNAQKGAGQTFRVSPLSNWTELDVWQYIERENIAVVPLYLAKERPVVARDGALIVVDDHRLPLGRGEVPIPKWVRFRTLGCYPLTGAIESHADTLSGIVQEIQDAKKSEHKRRLIDRDSHGSMEKKKLEGNF